MVSLVIALLAVLSPCASAHTDISALQAKEIIDSNDQLIVVDVRELYEYCDTVGHIPSAVNYPWNSGVLQQLYPELPVDSPVFVVCRLGWRSNQVATFLDSKGYLYVYDILGGMGAWQWETALCVDSDDDDLNDDLDNCPSAYNPSQEDSDGDGIGNACDQDCPNLDMQNPVDFKDFSILAQNWLNEPLSLGVDLNGDQFVDIHDLALFANYWLCNCYEDYKEELVD